MGGVAPAYEVFRPNELKQTSLRSNVHVVAMPQLDFQGNIGIVESRGRRLLVRRSGALLDGLWEPPGVDLTPGVSARRALAARLRELGLRVSLEPTGRVVRHAITHRAIEVEVWRGESTGRLAAGAAWHARGARERPLTALARMLLRARRRFEM